MKTRFQISMMILLALMMCFAMAASGVAEEWVTESPTVQSNLLSKTYNVEQDTNALNTWNVTVDAGDSITVKSNATAVDGASIAYYWEADSNHQKAFLSIEGINQSQNCVWHVIALDASGAPVTFRFTLIIHVNQPAPALTRSLDVQIEDDILSASIHDYTGSETNRAEWDALVTQPMSNAYTMIWSSTHPDLNTLLSSQTDESITLSLTDTLVQELVGAQATFQCEIKESGTTKGVITYKITDRTITPPAIEAKAPTTSPASTYDATSDCYLLLVTEGDTVQLNNHHLCNNSEDELAYQWVRITPENNQRIIDSVISKSYTFTAAMADDGCMYQSTGYLPWDSPANGVVTTFKLRVFPKPAPLAPAPSSNVPKTGDNGAPALWMLLLLAAAAGCMLTLRKMKQEL